MSNLIKTKEIVQDIFDRGITNVENIHNSISFLIFTNFSKVKPLTATVKTIENIHNITTDSVFDGIRNINKELGSWSTNILYKSLKNKTSYEGIV
ncbi:hypothetical protein MHK_001437 [Candidatus Magnetomorum sp. HK-1]|nr:hypothetical protein MHK_001437 [Candidatus Magnetomorum sp. HK-1]